VEPSVAYDDEGRSCRTVAEYDAALAQGRGTDALARVPDAVIDFLRCLRRRASRGALRQHVPTEWRGLGGA
jgi:hypothetical protein